MGKKAKIPHSPPPTLMKLIDQYVGKFPGSRRRYDHARQVFPAGVTHDLRVMDPFPIYIDRQ